MTRLVFDGRDVRRLFDHALNSKEHVPTFGMSLDTKYLKEGVVVEKGECPKREDIDLSKVPAHLELVKDEGIYLMSSGIPSLPGKDGAANCVVFARGYGRDASWDKVRDAVGGDDFVEGLELSFFQPAIDGDATEIWLNVTASRISMGFKPGPNAKKLETRNRPDYDKTVLSRLHREAKATKRPRWAFAGHSYKGSVLEVDGAVLYQLVRGQVVVHEIALLPAPLAPKGSTVEYVYGEDLNAPASIKNPGSKRAARKGV